MSVQYIILPPSKLIISLPEIWAIKQNHVTTINQGTFVPKSTLGTRLAFDTLQTNSRHLEFFIIPFAVAQNGHYSDPVSSTLGKLQPRSQGLRGETVTKTLVKFILSFQNFGKKIACAVRHNRIATQLKHSCVETFLWKCRENYSNSFGGISKNIPCRQVNIWQFILFAY